MGMKVRVIRSYMTSGGKILSPGAILEVERGVADILCNRRRPPVAEYMESRDAVSTLVPAPAGIGQAVEAVSKVLHPHRRKGR